MRDKEEKREYAEKYRAANKEKVAATKKAWYEKNKERLNAVSRAWRENNKEREAATKKAYYQANKEKLIAQTKAYLNDRRHEPVVYYLPEHHYVGVTECLYGRLQRHRSFNKRLTGDCEVIYTAKDITEARAVERYMHYEMGYNGKKGGTKGY